MKKSINNSSIAFVVLLLTAFLSSAISAQHLISSKAGFVNHVSGKVYILRQDSEDGEQGRASLGTQMREGDKLSTVTGSYAEVLLNPGSYLRLNEMTEVRAVKTNLNQVQFEVIKGSVILEVGEMIDKKSLIELTTPHGALFVIKDGLYRIDLKNEMTMVAARQGEIYVGTREEVLANKAFKIGRGKVAQLTGTPTPILAKLNQDSVDGFDTYSFGRAEKLMAANAMALRQSRNSKSLAYGWMFDASTSCYTFIPRRGVFWSPYGFGFFSTWNNCYTYSCEYGYPYDYGYGYGRGSSRGSGGSAGGGGTTVPPRVVAGTDRAPVRRQIEGRRIDSGSGWGSGSSASQGGFSSAGSSSPSSSASRSASNPSSSSTISAPSAPTRSVSEAPHAATTRRQQ